MRIINVIVVRDDVVDSIDSFGVFEEQFAEDVVLPAEELFITKAFECGFLPEDSDDSRELISNGYFKFYNGSVCLSWSYID